MSTKALAIRGVISNWLGRVCAIVVAFVLTPVLVRGLGAEVYGVWAFLMSLISYYGLLELGFRNAGIKYISQYDAVGDHESISRILATNMGVNLLVGAVALAASFGVAGVFPYLMQVDELNVAAVRTVVVLTGASAAITICGQIFGVVLAAKQRFDLVNLLGVGNSGLTAAALIGIVFAGGGLVEMGVAVLCVTAMTQVAQVCLAVRLLPVRFRLTQFSWATLKMILGFSLLDVTIKTAKLLTSYAGDIMVGVCLGPIAVTYYSIANGLTRHVRKLARGVASVAVPVASQLDAQGRNEDLREMLLVSTRCLSGMAAALAVVVIAFGQPLIDLWIEPGYGRLVFPLLCLLMIARSVSMSTSALHAMLVGMGRLRVLSILGVVEGAIVVGGGTLLISIYGLSGMAWALLIAQVLVAGIGTPLYGCYQLRWSFSTFALRGFGPAALVAGCTGAAAASIGLLFPAENLWLLLAEMSFTGGVGLAAIYAFCLDRRLRREFLRAVQPKRRASSRPAAVETLAAPKASTAN